MYVSIGNSSARRGHTIITIIVKLRLRLRLRLMILIILIIHNEDTSE